VSAAALEKFATRFGWPDNLSFPLTIGHRGASAHATENTLKAFSLATELGAGMWELDTQLTKDGVCVVSHDDHLLRVFGIDEHISALTAAELAAMPGVQVPTYSAVASLARNLGTGLYVELKAASTGIPAWRELEANGQPFAVLGSFDTGFVRELREAGCPYPLSVLVPLGADPHLAGDAAGADIIHLCWERGGERPQDLVTADLLDRTRRAGREIVLWHEERQPIIRDLVDLPVLGICSDQPELVKAAAKKAAA